MKVLLIKPSEEHTYEPLGLMYLAAYIREYGDCEVKILDVSTSINLEREINNFAPDFAGISSMFSLYSRNVHNVAEVVKHVNKDIPVVVGGAHASALPSWVLEDENIDVVVKGEGEETLLEIANSLKEKKDISQIDGTVVKKDGGIVENSTRSFIKDLDTIPFPATDLVDMDVYFNENYNYTHSMSPPRAGVVTSRGCPQSCIYCSIHCLWQHTYRMRKPEKVVDEIEYLVNNYGVREIAFWDDNLSLDKKRMIGICDEIIKRGIRIRWCTPNGIGISTLDKKVLERMKRSGCYKLTFGIETGSPNTQKFIKKEYVNLKKSKEIIRYSNKIGIWTHSTFIIGFPYETAEDIKKTIDYAIHCGANMATFFIATPYPGTELYDIYKRENLLTDFYDGKHRKWRGSINEPAFDTKNFTVKQLTNYLSLARRKIYINRAFSLLNPLQISNKIRGKDEFKYFARQLCFYSKTLVRTLLI